MEADERYLLDGPREVERLRVQARLVEPQAEEMLERIGVGAGWRCVDLGCGGSGILAPLARRVGPSGRVVGVDVVPAQIAAARAYVEQEGLAGVEVIEADAYRSGLPRASFDLVHARALYTTGGRDQELLAEMIALARPGGTVAVQEPAGNPPMLHPHCPAHDRVWAAVAAAFAAAGGDLAVGRRTFSLLRGAGLVDVRLRAFAAAAQDRHPYMRNVLDAATALRPRILAAGTPTAEELDRDIAECERLMADPDTTFINYTMTQVWGRKPGVAAAGSA